MEYRESGLGLDKLSILCLKIYHMKEQTLRSDTDEIHIETCTGKLQVLVQQQDDLTISYNNLINDYANGVKVMKLYRQMKMYNDKNLNPILYKVHLQIEYFNHTIFFTR